MISLDVLRQKVFQVDGVTVTVGIVLVVVIVALVYWRTRK